ncbi:MAG TPA: Crp/Fnr family transcriptional regulator [Myxococcaceae bacterium]|nr:Crp/Fnr family transcriptional regulator [Myxococcaceae bacterium]
MLVTPRRPDAPRSTPTSPGDATLRTYPHQSVLYRPGDAVQTAFLIHSGRVRLLREGRTGRPAVFAILRQGDLFGDILRPETAVADELAVASGEVTVQVLESRSLKSQLESDPSLALELLRACADQVRGLRARILGLTFQEVPARLAETLLAVAEAHGERCAHDGETDLRGITQQDLADLVGASRSFVSTLVNELKREGVLGNVGRVLCIRDQKALRRLASSET